MSIHPNYFTTIAVEDTIQNILEVLRFNDTVKIDFDLSLGLQERHANCLDIHGRGSVKKRSTTAARNRDSVVMNHPGHRYGSTLENCTMIALNPANNGTIMQNYHECMHSYIAQGSI